MNEVFQISKEKIRNVIHNVYLSLLLNKNLNTFFEVSSRASCSVSEHCCICVTED